MPKVIIDADPGVDDAFAIILACKNKLIDLLGITVVAGNCGLDNGIRNSFKLLDMCDKYYIPVYKGAEVSLETRDINAAHVHGENGFGDFLYEPIVRSVDGDAVEYLINTVNENPGQIDVVAIGPLTNIALAIMKDKNFAKNLKGLYIMGGSKVKGNISKFSEFNFYQDPHAADIVFKSDIANINVFGLNVTTKLTLNEKYEKLLQENSTNEIADILYKITRKGAEFDRFMGYDGLHLNDPLVIAYLINSNVAKMTPVKISMVTEGEEIGNSIIKMVDNSNIYFAYEVDKEIFYDILFKAILEE